MRFSILFLLLLTACGPSGDDLAKKAPYISENFTDDRGKTVSFSRPPSRIVSLAPNVTEMLFAIGAGDRVVGRSHACNWPLLVEDLPEVRTFPQLNAEAALALKPDFIAGSMELQKSEDMSAFEELGIPVMLQNYSSTADIYRNIRQLGKVLKLEKDANALADRLEKEEALLAKAADGQVRYATLILISADPLIAVGGKGHLGEMLNKAGARNVFEMLDESYAEVTEEAIVKANPEFLILASSDDKMYNKLLEKYPSLHSRIPAAVSNQVFILDPNLLLRPGPRSVEGFATLIQVLHPRVSPFILLDENSATADSNAAVE